MAKSEVDVRALAVVAMVSGDEQAIELLSKLVALLVDRRPRKKSTRH
jgi:hypothetical protein